MAIRTLKPKRNTLTKRQKRTFLMAIWVGLNLSIMEYFMFGNILRKGEIPWRQAIDYYHLSLTITMVSIYVSIFYVATGKITLRNLFQSIAFGLFTGVFEDAFSAFLILGRDPEKTMTYLSTSKWLSEVWNGVYLGWIFGIPTWYVIYLTIFILITFNRKKIPDTPIIDDTEKRQYAGTRRLS